MNLGDLIIRITADTDDLTRGTRRARREIDDLPDEHVIRIRIEQDRIDRVRGSLDRTRGLISVIGSLLPIAAAGIQATIGAVGGLVSMIGDATIGTVSFAAVATATLNDVLDAQKQINKANQDMDRASSESERQTALENMAKAYRGLSEEQIAALSSLSKFKSFWDDFSKSFQKPVVVAFTQALEGFKTLIEFLGPTVTAAGNAIMNTFQRANAAMKGLDVTRFFDSVAKNVGPVMETFGMVFMDVMQGVMNIMVAFEPVSAAMQGGLRGLSQGFLQWTRSLSSSEQFKQFLNFVISTGPQFVTTLGQITVLVMDLVNALAPLGKVMIGLINVIVTGFNAFTAFALGLSSLTVRTNEFKNALKSLLGFQTAVSNTQTSAIFDVDKAYKDMFGSVGDVTGGLKDAKKAADNFLQSFDEVHNINDKGGGEFTAPTAPTPSTGGGGNPWNQPEMDDATGSAPSGPDWIQKLIDKIKQIPPLIPMRIDPPDGGGGPMMMAMETTSNVVRNASQNMVLAIQAVIAKMNELPSVTVMVSSFFASMAASIQNSGLVIQTSTQTATTAVQVAWHGMLDYMQVQLNAYNPYLTFGWNSLMLTLLGVVPASETVSKAWHTMLDYMQSQLNAYRPYLEYGLALLGTALSALVENVKNTVTNWQLGFQAIMQAVSAATSPIVQMIDSVRAAYASLMAMMKQPIVIPPITLPALPKIEMPEIVTNITDTLKNFDYASWFKNASKSLGEAGIDIGLGASGLKGAQAAGKAAEVGWPAVKAWLESLTGGTGKAVTGFAGGGIIGTDSIVRVGEQGRKEAIIPLESNAMQPFANAIASSMGGGGSSGGGDIVLQIDGTTFARLIAPHGIKESARIGGNMISTT